jgi:ligand-binding sensor domain-containing protein/signal transduction histidine kinase
MIREIYHRLFRIALVLLLGLSLAQGQTPAITTSARFDHLTIEHGLSQSLVYDIYQDDEGYLWFATQDGLNRYDGYSFKIFRNRIDDSTTISHNDVQSIAGDNQGNIWLATAGGGLNKYHIKSGIFTSFRSEIDNLHSLSSDLLSAVYIDQAGIIWIGTQGGGLNRLDPISNQITRYTIPEESPENPRSNRINCIFEDSDLQLWIGSERGLHKFRRDNGRFDPFNILPDENNYKVSSIIEDADGALWIGIEERGLAYYNPKDGSKILYDLNLGHKRHSFANKIRIIEQLSSGQIAIGTYGAGLWIFNPDLKTWFSFQSDSDEETTLSQSHIFTILEDRGQILWIGTFKGVHKFDLKAKKFSHHKLVQKLQYKTSLDYNNQSNFVLSIIKDKENNTWCGTLGAGLFRINHHTKITEAYTAGSKSRSGLMNNYIWSLYEDRKSNIWVGAGGDLYRYDKKSNKFDLMDFRNRDKNLQYLARTIYEDKQGNLWIGFYDAGLYKYDRETDLFESFRHIHLRRDERLPYLILAIYEDQNGILWIGTDGGGLIRFNPANQVYNKYVSKAKNNRGIGSPRVNDINEDINGNLLVGTSNGLVIIHHDRETIHHYDEKDGLENSFIYAIEIDRFNNYWVSTNRGISHIKNEGNFNLTFRNYDAEDGLQSNEFNTGSSFQTIKGEFLFGGINGYTSFFPEQVRDNPTIPIMTISHFQIGEKVVKGSPAGSNYEIAYDDNTLTFEFASLEYTNPRKHRYQYKMEGFDEEWIESGERRFTTYTNLDAGDYIFKVKGTNNDGVWSSEDARIHIKIIPPLWQTTWAYIGYAIIFIIGLITLIKLRERKHEADKRILAQKVEEKTEELKNSYAKLEHSQQELIQATKMKAIGTMASGMAHSFNNLLMMILGSSQLLLEKFKDTAADKQIRTIEKAATDGAEIIKKLQKFGQTEGESLKKSVNLNEIIEETIEIAHFKLSDQKRLHDVTIGIQTNLEPIAPVYGNVSELRLVFIDLIVNAIESYKTSGMIQISTYSEGDKVAIKIKDKGVGIEKEILDHIFDPFYKTGSARGDGLGLSQIYSVINQHGGTIKVDSSPGQGTVVVIILPAEPVEEEHTTREDHHVEKTKDKAIFIVEDEQMIRDLYVEVLEMKGHSVTSFSSGEDALAEWKNNGYKLIICDLGLPGMNGWEFISKVRETDTYVPIIVLTGWGNEIGEERAKELDVQKVLAKPVSLEELMSTINDLT